jgi:hypothetical protein
MSKLQDCHIGVDKKRAEDREREKKRVRVETVEDARHFMEVETKLLKIQVCINNCHYRV